jgi:hypothetical protein
MLDAEFVVPFKGKGAVLHPPPRFGGAAGHSGPSGNAVGEHAPIVRDRRFHRPGRWQAVVAPLVQSQVYNGY